MFADLHSIKTNEPSFRDDRLSGIVKMIRAAHCSAGGARAFHPQKPLSQHLLRKFRFQRVTEAVQKYQYSLYKLIFLFCSLALVPSLSLFEFPIKAKLGLKGSAPLSKDLFSSIVMEVNVLRREVYLKERLKYLPSLNSPISHTGCPP